MRALMDRGIDVNKPNDDGLTALSATLALLLRDQRRTSPAVRRPDDLATAPSVPAPQRPPASEQVPADSPAADTSGTTVSVGRLNVVRASRDRDLLTDLLNEPPLPPPVIYFDAAGRMYEIDETGEQKAIDQQADGDEKVTANYYTKNIQIFSHRLSHVLTGVYRS